MFLSSNRRNNRRDMKFVAFFVLIATFIVSGLVFGVFQANKESAVTACVVNDKDRTTTREGKSDMRVYTDNCGTFQVGDALLVGQFNSADVYSSIKIGKTYDFTTRGIRVPILSAFPNIVKATEVK